MTQAIAQRASHASIWRISWPIILSNLSTPLLGLVDTAVLGHLPNEIHLAAVALGATIVTFIFWTFGFLRMGTSSEVGRLYGEGKPAQSLLAQSFMLALMLGSVLIACSSYLASYLIQIIPASESIKPFTQEYTSIRLLGSPITLLQYVFIGFFIGRQQTKIILFITLVINLTNIVLSISLVIGLQWGSAGAALASVIAELVGLITSIIWFSKENSLSSMPFKKSLKQYKKIQALLAINIDLFFRTFCLLSVFLAIAILGAIQGNTILSANALLLQLLSLCAYFLDGFAHACETLTAYFRGLNNTPLFWQTFKRSSVWACVFAFALALIFALGQAPILYVMTSIESVFTEANRYYFWLVVLAIVSVAGYQLDGVFIGLGRMRALRNAMIFCVCLGFAPAWYFTSHWGNHGIWFALTCFNILRGMTLCIYLLYIRQKPFKH